MSYPSFQEIREVHHQLVDMRLEYWLHNNVFTFQWWLLLVVLIVPWFIWWMFVDKRRLKEILLFGTILMILVIVLDDLGVELQLWSYPYQLFSLLPRLISIDQGIIIVFHMLVYQYFPKWKIFIIANIIMAAIFTYIFEPITVWIGIYELDNWRYSYSLPIYVIKAVLVKGIVDEFIVKYVRKKTGD
ncbi:CBO0543 family protein [Evansella sp. AB-rgal1]|uniref:CBO0543 family protein n=1 Tax=Evansella sp. AB-rgal1 TaxID=3242696 RepID=UPI00359CFCDC